LRSLLGIVSPDLLASCTSEATGRDVVLSGFFSSTRIFPHHAPNADLLEKTDAALAAWESRILRASGGAYVISEAKRTLIARALVHEPQTPFAPARARSVLKCNLRDDPMRELASKERLRLMTSARAISVRLASPDDICATGRPARC